MTYLDVVELLLHVRYSLQIVEFPDPNRIPQTPKGGSLFGVSLWWNGWVAGINY